MNYTKEQMVQTYGDGFFDGFKKAMEIQNETGGLDYDVEERLYLSEVAELEWEDNMGKEEG